jgi:hypothetical protein
VLELVAAVLLAADPASPGITSLSGNLDTAVNYSFVQSNRQAVGGGLTQVSVESGVPTPRNGFFPMRVGIDNFSGPSQVVRLSFIPSVSGAHSINRSVELKAGERRHVDLIVPFAYRYGKLVVRGPGITTGGETAPYFNAIYGAQRLVLSLGLADEFEKAAGQAASHTAADLQVQAIPVDEAPQELAAYAGYDAVVIPKAGIDTLSEASRRALEAYVATGGVLIAPNAGRAADTYFPLARSVDGNFVPYGLGYTLFCAQCGKLNLPQVEDGATHRDLAIVPLGQSNQGYRPYNQAPVDALLPQATAPLGRFLAIIGAFTLLIGPGSIFVARRRGPAALLVTIPGTAFVTCVVIIGTSLIEDGFSVHASSHAIVLLDSARHRAISAGVTAYYANLAPSSARFDLLTAVMGPGEGRGEVYGAGMDWGESAVAGSDFLPSRTYREWGYLSVQPTRARVVVKKSGTAVRIQNALGAKVNRLFAEVDGLVYEVDDLRDGSEATAKLAAIRTPELGVNASKRFGAHAMERLRSPLENGEFQAELSESDLMPTGGLRLNHHDSLQVVRGGYEQ